MIQLKADQNKIYTTAVAKLDDADYNKLLPFVRQKVDEFDTIRWYFEMREFEGWNPISAWRDVKFDFGHPGYFKRIAMVGEKDWQEWMTQIMKPFTEADIKFFELKDQDDARAWIDED